MHCVQQAGQTSRGERVRLLLPRAHAALPVRHQLPVRHWRRAAAARGRRDERRDERRQRRA